MDTGIGPACVGRSVRATTWGVSGDSVVTVGTDGVCASRRVQPVTGRGTASRLSRTGDDS